VGFGWSALACLLSNPGMTTALPKKWHWLPTGQPGHRFRNRYYQHQKSRGVRRFAAMIFRIILSALAAVVGFILVFIPGPAVVFFLISGALLAADWLAVARLLDWGEVHARRIWKRVPGRWRQASPAARIALVAGTALMGAAASYGFFRLMR
jgi:hypothetical protein